MILLSNSLANVGVRLPRLCQLILKHVRTTDSVLLGTFLAAYFAVSQLPKEIMVFYIDWYSGDPTQELIIAELLHKRTSKFVDEVDSYVHNRSLEVNRERMLNFFTAKAMNFGELLKFMRFYRTDVDQLELKNQL